MSATTVQSAASGMRQMTYMVPESDVNILRGLAQRLGWSRVSVKTAAQTKKTVKRVKEPDRTSPEYIAHVMRLVEEANRELEAGETVCCRNFEESKAFFDSL